MSRDWPARTPVDTLRLVTGIIFVPICLTLILKDPIGRRSANGKHSGAGLFDWQVTRVLFSLGSMSTLTGVFRFVLDQSQVFPWVLAAMGLGLVALSTRGPWDRETSGRNRSVLGFRARPRTPPMSFDEGLLHHLRSGIEERRSRLPKVLRLMFYMSIVGLLASIFMGGHDHVFSGTTGPLLVLFFFLAAAGSVFGQAITRSRRDHLGAYRLDTDPQTLHRPPSAKREHSMNAADDL